MNVATVVRRGGIIGLLVCLLAVFGVFFASQQAQAGAFGCNYYSWGQYCVTVDGSGTHVDYVHPSFVSRSKVCNWDVSAEFFDANNHWYKTVRTPIHFQCSFVNYDDVWVKDNVQQGFVCSTLRTNSSPMASRCESIH